MHEQVHKANQSSFSRTLQDWVSLSLLTTCADLDERKNAIMNVFDFWVESPLESLIEVGIRKITGDLTHHLVGEITQRLSSFYRTAHNLVHKKSTIWQMYPSLNTSWMHHYRLKTKFYASSSSWPSFSSHSSFRPMSCLFLMSLIAC